MIYSDILPSTLATQDQMYCASWEMCGPLSRVLSASGKGQGQCRGQLAGSQTTKTSWLWIWGLQVSLPRENGGLRSSPVLPAVFFEWHQGRRDTLSFFFFFCPCYLQEVGELAMLGLWKQPCTLLVQRSRAKPGGRGRRETVPWGGHERTLVCCTMT